MSVLTTVIKDAGGSTLLDLRSAHATVGSNGQPRGYAIEGADLILLDVGSVSWERNVATSPLVSGDVEVSARKADSPASFTVIVFGQDEDDVRTKIGNLVPLVQVRYWYLHLTVNASATYAWKCSRADTNVGVTRQFEQAHVARVGLSFTRSPIPVLGPI